MTLRGRKNCEQYYDDFDREQTGYTCFSVETDAAVGHGVRGDIFAFWYFCLRMPGESYSRANQTGSETALKPTVYENPQEDEANEEGEEASVEEQLQSHVVHLAETI